MALPPFRSLFLFQQQPAPPDGAGQPFAAGGF